MSVRGFCRGACNIIFHLIYRMKIDGLENIPKEGGVLLCSNHISNGDPIAYIIHIKRMLYAMAKEELFKTKFTNWFFRKLGCFPVKRGKGDMDAIENAVGYLKQGDLVAIYPEGARNGLKKGIKPKKGAALVALKAQVPVIPMAIKASFIPFTKIRMKVGKPIDLSKYYEENGEINPRSLITVTNIIMEQILDLLSQIEENN